MLGGAATYSLLTSLGGILARCDRRDSATRCKRQRTMIFKTVCLCSFPVLALMHLQLLVCTTMEHRLAVEPSTGQAVRGRQYSPTSCTTGRVNCCFHWKS